MDPIFFPGTMVTKDLDPRVENPSFPSKALLLNGLEALKLRNKDMGRSSLASIQRSLTHCTDWWLLTYLDLNFSIAPWTTPNQPLWGRSIYEFHHYGLYATLGAICITKNLGWQSAIDIIIKITFRKEFYLGPIFRTLVPPIIQTYKSMYFTESVYFYSF